MPGWTPAVYSKFEWIMPGGAPLTFAKNKKLWNYWDLWKETFYHILYMKFQIYNIYFENAILKYEALYYGLPKSTFSLYNYWNTKPCNAWKRKCWTLWRFSPPPLQIMRNSKKENLHLSLKYCYPFRQHFACIQQNKLEKFYKKFVW